jgi:hypothetical protein
MLSVEEKLLIEKRVAEFAITIVDSVNSGDVSATTENLLIFYEFLCRAFEAAKKEGRMNAIAASNSNN